jgi:hypothetical protein
MSSSAGPEKECNDKAPTAPTRYPLRVDVAKPAVVYQPSFGKDKDKEKEKGGKEKEVKTPSAGKPESSATSPGGSAATPRERVLGKRRRGGRTEFLVKRAGSSESTWESSKAVSARAVQEFEEKRQSRQLLQSRLATAKQAKQPAANTADGPITDKTPHRILAQRRLEGGQRYLIHWVGQSVTDASWESAKRLNSPSLIHEFEQAVRATGPTHPPTPVCAFPRCHGCSRHTTRAHARRRRRRPRHCAGVCR